jgi:hypothetical protein
MSADTPPDHWSRLPGLTLESGKSGYTVQPVFYSSHRGVRKVSARVTKESCDVRADISLILEDSAPRGYWVNSLEIYTAKEDSPLDERIHFKSPHLPGPEQERLFDSAPTEFSSFCWFLTNATFYSPNGKVPWYEAINVGGKVYPKDDGIAVPVRMAL